MYITENLTTKIEKNCDVLVCGGGFGGIAAALAAARHGAKVILLEKEPENEGTINEIFRAAHSLKGMAGRMGYKRMQALTHDMENVFSEVRNGNIKVKPEMIDILFQCLDALEEYNNNIQQTADEGTNDNEPLIKQLNEILAGKSADDEKKEAPKKTKKAAKSEVTEEKWNDINLDDLDDNQQQYLIELVDFSCSVFILHTVCLLSTKFLLLATQLLFLSYTLLFKKLSSP